MEETSGNMALQGAIESQDAHATPTAATPDDEDAHGASPVENAASNGVIQAPEASETTANVLETTAPTSTATAEAAPTPSDNATRSGNEAFNEEEPKSDEDVVVNLKFLHRERVTLQCPAAIPVADLKQRVRHDYIQAVQQEQTGGGASEQHDHEPEPATQPLRLIYKGKVLKDDHTLASYNFLSDDTIHAVFSRASTAAAAAPPTPAAQQTPAAAAASASVASSESGDEESDGGVTFTRFDIPEVANVGTFISSVLTSTLNAYRDGGESLPTLIFPLAGGAASAPSTASTTSATPSPSTPSASTPSTRATAPPPSTTAQSSARQPVRPPEATRPSVTQSGSSLLLLNEAAALRRSIPALELVPLSRPRELSTEMYNLGNAMRESGDTYLAVHRQLQFVATRFLQENHLNNSERERLRSRVQQLVPVMDRLRTLSTSVAQQLASSSFGNGPATSYPRYAPPGEPAARAAEGTDAAPSASANPALSVSTFLNLIATLAGATQAPPSTIPVAGTAPTPNAPSENAREAPGIPLAPISAYPLWSLGYKIQQHLATCPNYLSLSLDEFTGVVSGLVINHIVRCCEPGIDQFLQIAGEEVENAFKAVEEAQGRVYSRVESRCGIVRAALQELATICSTTIDAVDAVRNAKITSWLRRSCLHLLVEVSEFLDARTASKITAEVLAHVLTASPTPRTPFHEAVGARTSQYLQSRFSFA